MSQPSSVNPSLTPYLPPPSGQKSNFINPLSIAPVAEDVGGLLIAIETILLILRTCSNVKTFGKIRLEDCWTTFAAMLTYTYFAFIMCFRPIARHGWDIPLTEAISGRIYKLSFSFQIMVALTLFFSKSSLLLLYYRIFSPDKIFRYQLYGAFGFIAVTTLSMIPMYLAICLPESNLTWEEMGIKCHKTVVISYIQGPTQVAFDIFLIYLPASVIIHLQLPLRRKVGTLIIFMTGILALVASIIALIFRIRLARGQDGSWEAYITDLCILVEACVSIICSCMPAIPAIAKMITGNSLIMMLQSRLRSRYASSGKSKSSKASSRHKPYLGDKTSGEPDGRIGLVNNESDCISTPSAIRTHIEHVARPKPLCSPGISMLVELEMTSTNVSGRESDEA